jgi:hypothetical protein
MSAIYPNIVPENNLRLPDAVTIAHGDAPLLSRFVLEADKAARAVGIRLFIRNDFDVLAALNDAETARGAWYPLAQCFDPRHSDISAENGFWLAGEDDGGEIVCTNVARIHDWRETNFVREAVPLFYGRDEPGATCVIPAASAVRSISGVVQNMGAMWLRPDHRGRGMAKWATRILKAYGLSRWPIDWVVSYIRGRDIDSGLGYVYGGQHFVRGIYYPGLKGWDADELVLSYTSRNELFADLARYLTSVLSSSGASESAFAEAGLTPLLAEEVINSSPAGPRQGSSSRS